MSNSELIPVSAPDVSGNERKYLNQCIDSGWVSSAGDYVKKFESGFAAYCQCKFGATVNTGTAALHLALRCLGIGEGDEVIVPAITFASTANAVLYVGATPVFADCSPNDWNLDAQQLGELLSSRTRAIIPVHLYGQPCEMAPIMALAKSREIFVVEDAAEAHGASYAGAPVGSIGDIGCFSFYGNKIITTGEGGMCVTNQTELFNRMCVLRDHGMDKRRRYWHNEVGFNYRMTNLQAAVGCAQLERIDEFVAKKRWITQQYNARLQASGCILPQDPPGGTSVFWLYTLLLPVGTTYDDRDQLIRFLAERQIESRPLFYPISDMPPYQKFARPLPNSATVAARGITLPSFHGLTESQIDRVATVVREWLAGGA